MDAPPIQYAKTADGIKIAYWVIGEGPPLVILPSLLGHHVQLVWEADTLRIVYERLAERATVITFDCRGLGLSQSDCLDLSAEAQALDLEAVADHLGLERFAMYGSAASGEVLLAYPGSHPERVSHLIVSFAPFPHDFQRRFSAIQPLMEQDWEMFTDIFARLVVGWDDQRAAQIATRMRASHTPATCASTCAVLTQLPAPLLSAIHSPTLILHALSNEPTSRAARKLASGIAGAHLLGVPNWPIASYFRETMVTVVLDFINTSPATPGAPVAAPNIDISAVRTIVFTDVEGSTALNERLGDEGAREVLREQERLTREALRGHGGSEVKAMGDGFMVWFPSATRAVECAIALQKAFDARNRDVGAQRPSKTAGAPIPEGGGDGQGALDTVNAAPLRPGNEPPEPILIRIGINAGEPIAEGDDLFGASVIATARIAAQAKGGQILASDVVRQLLAGKGFTFADQGEHSLKGFEEPARLYEVRWETSPLPRTGEGPGVRDP